MNNTPTKAREIPSGYFRRLDGSTAVAAFYGAEGDRLTCEFCGQKVVYLYGYEHESLPDIEMCRNCVQVYESS